ncbi:MULTISPECIES: hypothetical protein [unclassified Novosphingobium]|uniref:hypothetical protein n=1 Tax=unclassified Novosphingobium TaxID=2644732 RepID=UPI0025DE682D|nr:MULTISPECIES: hypothetical protein [unclassified Novosphingobium]HQV04286.1 hypothetical protein [Novosphingobium sp.]
MLRIASILRLALVLVATLAALPAQAAVCDRFAEPLTQASATELGREVRSLFSERYQRSLADVRIAVDEDEFDVLALAQSGKSYEIVVSATYLRTSCGLALWALLLNPQDAEQRANVASMARKSCPVSLGSDRRACMLGFINGLLDGSQDQMTDKREFENLTPLIEQMVLSSFVFALAHEYSHVIIERGGSPFARLARTDNELAADFQAISIFASGRAWPASDSLLFNGRREFDYLLADEEQAPAAHDAAYCRAARSAAIRQAISPNLTAINRWRSGQDPSFALSVLPVLMNNVTLSSPKTSAPCNLELPAEVSALIGEMAALAKWTENWPRDPAAQALAIKALLKMPIRTETGTLTRAGMTTSYVLAPGFEAINGTLDGTLKPAVAASWAARFGLAAPLIGKPGNLSIKDRQKLTIAQAWSDFLAMAPGSRLNPGLRKAKSVVGMAQTNSFGRPDPTDLLTIAGIQLIDGDCRQGVRTVAVAVRDLKDPLRQFGAASILLANRDPVAVNRNNAEFASIADKAQDELVSPKAEQTCLNNVPRLRKALADNLGWKLDD